MNFNKSGAATLATSIMLMLNAPPLTTASERKRGGQTMADFAAIRAAEEKRARRAAKRAKPTPVERYQVQGMDIVVLPDTAPEMTLIPLDSVGSFGNKFFVRESMWPALKVAIELRAETDIDQSLPH